MDKEVLFQNEYFDLTNVIYEAFSVLAVEATEKMIEFKSSIDKPQNINAILQIYGDRQKYLSYMTNFLSKSISQSDIGSNISVAISILEQQLISRSSGQIHSRDEVYLNLQLCIIY